MDDRGYLSPVPYSDRSGYLGPRRGWLEQRGDGVWLCIRTGPGVSFARPGRFLIARPYGTNIFPRAGVRGAAQGWAIAPETVVVDFMDGYAGMPVVVGAVRQSADDWLDTLNDPDRVAVQYRARDAATGAITAYVRAEVCSTGSGDLTVEATGDITLAAGGTVQLGTSNATDYVPLASLVNAQLDALEAVLSAWVPVPGDGGAALKALLQALIAAGWPADVSATKVKAV